MQRGKSPILFKILCEYNSFSSSPPRQHAIVKRVAERERTEAHWIETEREREREKDKTNMDLR